MSFKALEADKSCCSLNLPIIPDTHTSQPEIVFTSKSDIFEGPELELLRFICPFNVNEFVEENVSSEICQISYV